LIVDRVGARDSFAVGFPYGRLKKGNVAKGAQHGNAFAPLSRVDFGDLIFGLLRKYLKLFSSFEDTPHRGGA